MRTRKLLVALGATSMALIAAGPASAISRSYEATNEPVTTQQVLEAPNETPPVDENGKKSCAIRRFDDGGIGWLPHGTTITLTLPNGKSKTVKCVDGDWVEQSPLLQRATYVYDAQYALVAA